MDSFSTEPLTESARKRAERLKPKENVISILSLKPFDVKANDFTQTTETEATAATSKKIKMFLWKRKKKPNLLCLDYRQDR